MRGSSWHTTNHRCDDSAFIVVAHADAMIIGVANVDFDILTSLVKERANTLRLVEGDRVRAAVFQSDLVVIRA